MTFIDGVIARAKASRKRIVLTESEDRRVLEAASRITKDGIADIILLGEEATIRSQAEGLDLDGIEILDIRTSDKLPAYEEKLVELRSHKGMTPDKAKETLQNRQYYAVMMVKMGDADGMVAGAVNSTADTLRPALQILRTAPGTKLVSAFFIMELPDATFGHDGMMIFADCGLNEAPDAEQLAEIAIASGHSFELWTGADAKVAMLSYSTKGSASSEMTERVAEATRLARERAPELAIDGELQLDAAIVPDVAKLKAPDSEVAGHANTLIFPSLEAGNIGYKLVQRLGHAEAYGPVLQGIAAPVNDLSRGCSADDIVGVVALTAVQAQQKDND